MSTDVDRNHHTQKNLDPARRSVLLAMSSVAGLMACAGSSDSVSAQDEQTGETEEVFNAYNRTKSYRNDEMDGEGWTAEQTGEFDLDDPGQNRLARLKMTNNLVGRRTYIPMLIRLMIAREQEPGGLLLGSAGLFTWQLQVPDPKAFPNVPAGTALMRSIYTARHLDPDSMEPVDELKNPFNGQTMRTEDNIFVENYLSFPNGGTKFLEEPQFVDDPPDQPKKSQFKRWGDELIMFLGGSYSKPGKHQPRFTENMWASPNADVMDKDRSLVDTRYTFSGINKAFEKPWAGYDMDDRDSLVVLAYGKKVHTVDDLPDFHKRVIVDRYPDRV